MVLHAEEDYMTTTRDGGRSKILHNFTFSDLKWGNQRFLRCEKVISDGFFNAGDQRLRRRSSTSKFDDATLFRVGGGSDQRSNNRDRGFETEPSRSMEKEGIKEFREKMMSDLRTVVDKMSESIFRKQALGEEEEENKSNEKEHQREEKPKEKEVSPPETAKAKPWNLRKRRAPIPENENQHNYKTVEEKRVMNCSNSGNESKKERSKFLSTLSKKEIEDDYMKMMGHRPPRRPKKRLRTVQKQVDLLKPAFYFSEITEDLY